jgi:hypothetical protein
MLWHRPSATKEEGRDYTPEKGRRLNLQDGATVMKNIVKGNELTGQDNQKRLTIH